MKLVVKTSRFTGKSVNEWNFYNFFFVSVLQSEWDNKTKVLSISVLSGDHGMKIGYFI